MGHLVATYKQFCGHSNFLTFRCQSRVNWPVPYRVQSIWLSTAMSKFTNTVRTQNPRDESIWFYNTFGYFEITQIREECIAHFGGNHFPPGCPPLEKTPLHNKLNNYEKPRLWSPGDCSQFLRPCEKFRHNAVTFDVTMITNHILNL